MAEYAKIPLFEGDDNRLVSHKPKSAKLYALGAVILASSIALNLVLLFQQTTDPAVELPPHGRHGKTNNQQMQCVRMIAY